MTANLPDSREAPCTCGFRLKPISVPGWFRSVFLGESDHHAWAKPISDRRS